MKRPFVKITLTLCSLLVMAAPMPAFAAGDAASANKCAVNAGSCTTKICKVNGGTQDCGTWQDLFSQSGGSLNDLYIKWQESGLIKNPLHNSNCPGSGCEFDKDQNCGNGSGGNKPGVDKPETDKPEVDKPETDMPEIDKPETDKPGVDQPDADKPGTDKPGQDNNNGGGNQDNNNAGVSAYAQQVAALVNQQRAANGLPALKLDTKLSNVAEKKAIDMRDKNYFSHTSPTYGSPFDMMKQFGISYKAAGENIAKGQKNPESVMNGWMNSEGHRANILSSNFSEIGVGYVTDSKGNTYWVQMFIRP